MARRDASPDFIEALARGLDVIRVFQPRNPVMSLAAVAAAAGLARPTARRVLLTLEQLGYARATEGGFELTPRVLELGMAYVLSRSLWEVARPHLERLVAQTHESSSIAQLDGSDIVYVARMAVPKINMHAATAHKPDVIARGICRAGLRSSAASGVTNSKPTNMKSAMPRSERMAGTLNPTLEDPNQPSRLTAGGCSSPAIPKAISVNHIPAVRTISTLPYTRIPRALVHANRRTIPTPTSHEVWLRSRTVFSPGKLTSAMTPLNTVSAVPAKTWTST